MSLEKLFELLKSLDNKTLLAIAIGLMAFIASTFLLPGCTVEGDVNFPPIPNKLIEKLTEDGQSEKPVEIVPTSPASSEALK